MHFKTHSFNNVPIDINIKIDNIFLEKKTSTKFLGLFWTTDYHGGIILTIYLPQYQEELESYTYLKMPYPMMCYLCYIIPLYSRTSITVISFGEMAI